jgi:D-amino-acid dehydrogenase
MPARVLIVGSGLIGLTTAYLLATRGHEVTVLDRREGPGQEASRANGGLLTPSMSQPWNGPGTWRVLLGSLVRADAPLQLRARRLPQLAGWGMGFLRNSAAAIAERNCLSNLRLALYSLQEMRSLREAASLDYGAAAPGALKIFRSPEALDQAAREAARLSAFGLHSHVLTPAQTSALEPALAPIESELAGAVHFLEDEIGDAYRYCLELAERARAVGVQFRFNTQALALEVESGKVTALQLQRERLVSERYIVCAGAFSTPLLRSTGIDVPVEPAKGYSLTLDLVSNEGALRVPLVDDDFHAAVVPFTGAIRVAGTAEFAGFDLALSAPRVRNLLRLLDQVLPQAKLDRAGARPWCGLRPMSVDGVPIIGATPLPNLLISTGHGHLGWTLAAGSARLLVDLLEGNTPAIDPAPYALSRFH